MTLDVGTHADYAHDALFHDGPAELAAGVAPDLVDGMARGDAVLVCLAERDWAHLAGALGERAADVRYLAPDVRYGRPGVAMATLQQFVDDAVGSGAEAVWSVGTVPFDGTPRDRRWLRYEHAVEDVLGHLPLRAVCTYDTATTEPALLAAARLAHRPLAGPLPSAEPTFAGAPLVDLVPQDVSSARRAIGAAFAGVLDDERLEDLRLVASEVVTNALRHGAAPVGVRAWHVGGDAVVQVVDDGAGWPDRYPDLRPNRGSAAGGYGWWLVGQLADAVDVVNDERGTVVTVSIHG